MSWAAVAAVGGSLITGAMSKDASKDASKSAAGSADAAAQAQLTGMREALAAQMQMFDFSLGANTPQRSMGYAGLGAMSQMLGMQAPQIDPKDYTASIQKNKDELAALSKQRKQLRKDYDSGKFQPGSNKKSKSFQDGTFATAATGATLDFLGGDKKKAAAKSRANAYIEEREALDKKIAKLKKANKTNQRAAREQDIQRQALAQFQPTEEGGGGSSLQQIQPFNFDFDESQLGQTDSYKFRQEQSLEALDRRLAAGGMRGSGNRYSGILEMASGMASQEYEAEYGRQYGRSRDAYSSQFDIYNLYAGMSGMAGVDTQAAAGVGGNMANIFQQGYAGMGDARIAGGQANAAGIMGQNNAMQNMMGQIFQIGGNAGWFDD